MKFTVLLARPDYIADSGNPVDVYSAHVVARDHIEAVVLAQHEAAGADGVHDDDHGDYYPIVVYPGHLESLT